MTEFERPEDAALRALFAAAPEPADDGFSQRVVARIGSRIHRRRLIIAFAVIVGAGIAAWPLGVMILQFSDSLRGLLVSAAGTDWIREYPTIIAGAVLALLTPVVAALLE